MVKREPLSPLVIKQEADRDVKIEPCPMPLAFAVKKEDPDSVKVEADTENALKLERDDARLKFESPMPGGVCSARLPATPANTSVVNPPRTPRKSSQAGAYKNAK